MRTFLALALIVPLIAFAQSDPQAQIDALLKKIAELQAQLAGMSATTDLATAAKLACPVFSRTLQRGSQGDDVRELQKILISGGYLASEPTGYFGPLTEKALQNFQSKTKIVSSGTPASTGWGVFGPKTRAFVASLCNRQLLDKLTPPKEEVVQRCAVFTTPQPTTVCEGVWQVLKDTKGCEVGWKCVRSISATTENKPPVIETVSGPTSLVAGQTGVWDVVARDPEGGSLQYSVIWGDEYSSSILDLLAEYETPPYSLNPRLMHTYTLPGQYLMNVNVRDGVGNISASIFTVLVGIRSASTSIPAPATGGVLPGSCVFGASSYPEGTKTEGYSVNDLCVATNGVCGNRTGYIPTFVCTAGAWQEQQVNPYPNLPNYADKVGSRCGATGTTVRGATTQVVVHPGTHLCRASLCATAQNFAPVTLTCEYEIWVDWGIFYTGATTTRVCIEPNVCEYQYGQGGKACAPKVNGACPVPQTNHPLGY